MNPDPKSHGARRSAGLAAIAIAVVSGPFVLDRTLARAGESPVLLRPEAVCSLAPDVARGSRPERLFARTSPPRGRAPDERALEDCAAADAAEAVPESEGEFYAGFLATWHAGEDQRRRLEERAPGILRSSGASAEKVALLRSLRDARSPASPELLALALRELPDVSGPHGVSVPAFVVSHLGRADSITEEERAVLEAAVHNSRGSLAPNTRGRALGVLVEGADEGRRLALADFVRREPDPLVRAMGEQALRSSNDLASLIEVGSW